MPEILPGLVIGMAAGLYAVEVEEGTLECTLRGRLRQDEAGRVAVGDRVEVERLADGSCRIAARLPRRSVLARRGPHGRELRLLAANVDQVAAVSTVARPDPDLRMLDRMLVLSEVNALPALVVVNKIDLLGERSAAAEPPPGFEPYAAAGYPVLGTSVRDGTGLKALRHRLTDRVTVLTGASGVGKSSLANRLIPGLRLRVGEVSERRGRGRRTTVSARLIRLPGGGHLADTPGFQFVGLGDLPVRELAAAFPEVRSRTDGCRFGDCSHREEPGCAVRAAVQAGEMSEERYRSYLALLEEAGVA